MATQINNSAWLQWIGNLIWAGSRQTETAALPSELFHCRLDELPLHLIPRWSYQKAVRQASTHGALFLNPECTLLSADQVPKELEDRPELLRDFCRQGSIAWVRDRATGALNPFWLGSKYEAIVSSLSCAEAVTGLVPQYVSQVLVAAGILIHEEHAAFRTTRWQEVANKNLEYFKAQNYVPLRGLIHPFHIAALRRYYRRAIRQGAIRLGDDQSPRRYVAHNDAVARFFHHQIASIVSATVGEAVKPSYVYFASYLPGAELKKHVDREQCEFSVTLCLDFSPEPELATSWPIRVQTSTGVAAIYQALGDGLIYRGTKVPHYRMILPEGFTSTSIFFHYVPAGFSGSLA